MIAIIQFTLAALILLTGKTFGGIKWFNWVGFGFMCGLALASAING